MKPIKDKRSKLEKERDRLLDQMADTNLSADYYNKLLEKAEKVNGMLMAEKDHRLTFDATGLIKAGSSLAGLLLIMVYENRHVISTKAMNFVTRV